VGKMIVGKPREMGKRRGRDGDEKVYKILAAAPVLIL